MKNAAASMMKIASIQTVQYFIFGLMTVILFACEKEDPESNATIPNAVTYAVENITETTAVCGGEVNLDGGAPVTKRGVCYGTSTNPTVLDSYTEDGSGLGAFESYLTGLSPGTTYFVRAYATNIAGTNYGFEQSFTTLGSPGSGGGDDDEHNGGGSSTGVITSPGQGASLDGHTYESIILGNGQEWLTENLRTTVYANGDVIPNVANEIQWNNLTTGAWAHYNNDNQYENPYGKLYNWYAVNDARNVCPNGWHVPTDDEWSNLTIYLGGADVAGGKLKGTGTAYWNSPNSAATNESGFTARPGGFRISNAGFGNFGVYVEVGITGKWWSSTPNMTPNLSWDRYLNFSNGEIFRFTSGYRDGLSIRCIKD